jgi:hypothetical protein
VAGLRLHPAHINRIPLFLCSVEAIIYEVHAIF